MNDRVRCVPAHSLLAGAVMVLLALTPMAAQSQVHRICDDCFPTENDTSFTPGKSAITRIALLFAVKPAVGFVGKDGLLRCALPATLGWQIELVDPAALVGGLGMTLDDLGEPMLSYHDAQGRLRFARHAAGGWTTEVIDASGQVGGVTSIARFPGGVAIAYEDTVTSALWYAERIGAGPWTIEPVTLATELAAGPSLVADGPLRAIAYYDRAARDLRIALRHAGPPWTTSMVDGVGDAGGYASLVGGPSLGGFGIAYYDFTQADLRYAFGEPGGWTIETVEGAGVSVGRFCSAVQFGPTPADRVGIGYYDQTNGDLKFALKRGVWTTSVQDAAGDVGGSVACGATGFPSDSVGIAYVDRARGDLLYQWHAGTVTAAPEPAVSVAPVRIEWRSVAGSGRGRVRFTVPEAGMVRVAFYDLVGRTIAVPLRRALAAGPAEVLWDGRDLEGRPVPSGVLFVRVETRRGAGAVPAVVLR